MSFKPTFLLSSFTFIERLFSYLFSATRVVSSAYLRLLIFSRSYLDASLCFIQPGISHDVLCTVCCSTSGSNCCFMTCKQVSQEAGQVVWYSHLFKNFPQFVVMHTVKGFSAVYEADFFWNSLASFLYTYNAYMYIGLYTEKERFFSHPLPRIHFFVHLWAILPPLRPIQI